MFSSQKKRRLFIFWCCNHWHGMPQNNLSSRDSFGTSITDNLSGLLGKQYPHKKLSRFSSEMRYGNFCLWLDSAIFFPKQHLYIYTLWKALWLGAAIHATMPCSCKRVQKLHRQWCDWLMILKCNTSRIVSYIWAETLVFSDLVGSTSFCWEGLIMPSRCGSTSRLVPHILLRSKAQLGCRFIVTSTVLLLVGHQIMTVVGRSTFVRILHFSYHSKKIPKNWKKFFVTHNYRLSLIFLF